MARQFEDKVIIITGAGSGIGRATSIALSHLGASLALCDINGASSVETKSLCASPEKHLTPDIDVGSSAMCKAVVADICRFFGRVDHVFNCAGVNPTSTPVAEISDEYYDRLMDANVRGTFNVTRACIPFMKSGSTFVNVSSICGLQPTAGFSVYCASKYAVIGFSRCMALELGPKGIRTNVVAPGYVDTPTNAGVVAGKEAMGEMESAVALGRMGNAEEIADVVVFLMGEGARYMNGSVVEVNGGVK